MYNNTTKPEVDYRIECSNDIYNLLKAHGVPTIIYIDCDMKHGLEKDTCGTCYITTNFGIKTNTTLNDVNNYMASRFAFFARAIYRGDAPYLLGTSRFTSCEDFRKGCSRVADNDTCTGANSCGQSFDDE